MYNEDSGIDRKIGIGCYIDRKDDIGQGREENCNNWISNIMQPLVFFYWTLE